MLPDQLAFFAKLIERELGIIYSDFNAYQLENRLNEVVQILGLKSVADLETAARDAMTPAIRQLLMDTATNNETSFFRDPRVFQAVKNLILPRLAETQNEIRVWSAACSFGQEPYSLSLLAEEFTAKSPSKSVEILATDISNRALQRAKNARYTQLEVQRGLPTQLLIKYFTKDDENFWSLQPSVRQRVTFQTQNLLDPFTQLGSFDLILCRNVLIYQNVEKKAEIIHRLYDRLSPNGVLVLGAGESMIGLSEAFEAVRSEETIVYTKRGSSLARSA